MTYCSQVAISEMLRQCHVNGTAYLERDGKELSVTAQIRILRDAQRMGQEWYPACANPDRTGKCQGHEETKGE